MSDLDHIRKEIEAIKIQQVRLEGFIGSETGNITRQLNNMEKKVDRIESDVKGIQLWKSNVQGKVFVAGIVIGTILSYIIKKL